MTDAIGVAFSTQRVDRVRRRRLSPLGLSRWPGSAQGPSDRAPGEWQDGVMSTPYDALLLVSFGGPEQPDDVMPFLRNVTSGKPIPAARLEEVADHYLAFGGKSPIMDQCRALVAGIESAFGDAGIDVPVYWGNRNWDPYLVDVVAKMEADGVTRAACFVTSAYASYSGCRQYREDLFAASAASSVRLDRLRHFYNHPGFVEPYVDSTVAALSKLSADAHLIFVTHSIPVSMNTASGGPGQGAYERQHRDLCAYVARVAGGRVGRDVSWTLAYCSRSGSPATPWLEPDVNDELQSLHDGGTSAAAVVPIGFVSDHMEVIYDLDVEAAATARRLEMGYARAATPATDPRFTAMICDLFVERAAAERGEPVTSNIVDSFGSTGDVCASDCCPNARGPRPTIGNT